MSTECTGSVVELFNLLQIEPFDAVNGAGKWMLGNRVDVYRGKMEHVKVRCEVHAMWCTIAEKQCCNQRGISTWQTWSGRVRQRSRAVQQATDGTCAGTRYKEQGFRRINESIRSRTSGTRHASARRAGTKEPDSIFVAHTGSPAKSQCDTPIECWLLVMNM